MRRIGLVVASLILVLGTMSVPALATSPSTRSNAAPLAYRGADVSSLHKSETLGGIYRWDNGRPGDALAILRAHGLNAIRLRAWVNPADGFHDTRELLLMSRRAKALGLKVLVDFHFSDFWADPGKQWTPAAWVGPTETFADLRQHYLDYLDRVMRELKAQHTPPAMVQLGNEIDPGLLWDYTGADQNSPPWPSAATWTGCSSADDGTGNQRTVCHTENWDDLAGLLTSGYHAVKQISPKTKVMLHLSSGGDSGLYRWWFDNITQRNVPFDVIGASYYSYWHGPFSGLQANLDDVAARYGKPVVVVETAYPFTLADQDGTGEIIGTQNQLTSGYPATPKGQAANLRDVMNVVRNVPNGRGLGVFYWEATWTAVPGNGWSPVDPSSGNGWENQALWDFNQRPLPAMDDFRP